MITNKDDSMSKIVKTISRLVYGLIITYGLYIILHGHLTPGGGFQGGAVVASAFALLIVSYGKTNISRYIDKDKFSLFESIGAIAFLILALVGIGTTFFYNELVNSGMIFGNNVITGPNSGDLNTGGLIPIMNFSVGLKVLAGIGAILFLMSLNSGSRLEDGTKIRN